MGVFLMRWVTPSLVTFTFIGFAMIAAIQLRRHWLTPQELAGVLGRELTNAIGLPVQVQRMTVSLREIRVQGIQLLPDRRSPTGYFLTLPEVRLRWSLPRLLSPSRWRDITQKVGQIVDRIIVTEAVLFLWRDREGRLNVEPLLKPRKPRRKARLPLIVLRASTLIIGDETLPLPNGIPFQIQIRDADGTIRPVNGETHFSLTGFLTSPLGDTGSRVTLSFRQSEDGTKMEGTIRFQNLQVTGLPKRFQSLFGGRLKIHGGVVREGQVRWRWVAGKAEVSLSLRVGKLWVTWQEKQPFSFDPLDASISVYLSVWGGQVQGWHVMVQTEKPHPQLGWGKIVAEGRKGFWRFRWRGKSFSLSCLFPTLPFKQGWVNGSVTLERRRQWHIHADLIGTQIGLVLEKLPGPWKEVLPRPSIAFPQIRLTADLKGQGRRWQGFLSGGVRRRAMVATVKAWLRGNRGAAEVHFEGVSVGGQEGVWQFIQPLLPKKLPILLQVQGGYLAGRATIIWEGQRWEVQRASVRLIGAEITGDGFPSARLFATISAKGQRFTILQGRLQWDEKAFVLMRGRVDWDRAFRWQARGRATGPVLETLARWVSRRFPIPTPFALLQGGHFTARGGGWGRQWNFYALWDKPEAFLLVPRVGRVKVGIDRMTAYIAPQGGFIALNIGRVDVPSRRLVVNGLPLQVPKDLWLDGWRILWDAAGKTLTAYGHLRLPEVRLERLSLRRFSCQVAIKVRFFRDKRPSLQIALKDGEAELWRRTKTWRYGGRLKGFHFLWDSDSQSGQAKGVSEGIQLANLNASPSPFQFGGKLKTSFQISFRLDPEPFVQLGLRGEAREICIRRISDGPEKTPFLLTAQKVRFNAATGTLRPVQGKWQLLQGSVEITLQGGEISAMNWGRVKGDTPEKIPSLPIPFLHVQFAVNTLEGKRRWRFMLPELSLFGGMVQGQVDGEGERWQGHLSVTSLDLHELASWLAKVGVPEAEGLYGKVAAWMRWRGQMDGLLRWEIGGAFVRGGWGKWVTWQLMGIRMHGRAELQDLVPIVIRGTIDGVHVLADDGEAALTGKFRLEGKPLRLANLDLQGEWGNVSLSRLSVRLMGTPLMEGLLGGTVKVHWDGEWQAEGAIRCDAFGIGETVWQKLQVKWGLTENQFALTKFCVSLAGKPILGRLKVSLHQWKPVTITAEAKGKDLPLRPLLRLAQIFGVPVERWKGNGQVTVHLYLTGTPANWRLNAQFQGQKLSLQDIWLGELEGDALVVQDRAPDGTKWALSGTAILTRLDSSVLVSFAGKLPRWKVRWEANKLGLAVIRKITDAALKASFPSSEGWRHWLLMPLNGDLWLTGTAEGIGRKVTGLSASLNCPILLGVGAFPLSLRGEIRRDERGWRVRLVELRHGYATASGWVQVSDDRKLRGKWQVKHFTGKNLTGLLNLFGVHLKIPLPDGTLYFTATLNGTLSAPRLIGSMRIDGLRWRSWSIRKVHFRRFLVTDKGLSVLKGDGRILWGEEIPPTLLWGTVDWKGGTKLHVTLEIPPTPLTFLLPLDFPLQVSGGEIQGHLKVTGTLKDPRLTGELVGKADKIVLSLNGKNSLPFLTDCRWHLIAGGQSVRLKELKGRWGDGEIVGEGFFTLREGGFQDPLANEGRVTLRARDISLPFAFMSLRVKSLEVSGELRDGQIIVTFHRLLGDRFQGEGAVRWGREVLGEKGEGPSWVKLLRGGEWKVALAFDDFHWRFDGMSGHLSGSLQMETTREGNLPLLWGQLTVHRGDIHQLTLGGGGKEPSKWQMPEAVRFDILVRVGRNFFLRNPQVTILLDGQIRLTGDLSRPHLSGEILSRRGTVHLPEATLTLTTMEISFSYGVDPTAHRWTGTARLRLEGETQLDVHRVFIFVSGPVDPESQRQGVLPSVTVFAVPPLPEETALRRMFGLGLAGVGRTLTDWRQLFSGTMVQGLMGSLLVPLTTKVARALNLTQLRVIRERQTGRQWFLLGIPLTPRLHVLWRRGLTERDPSALEVQYFLGKQTSVTWTKRERERAEIRVQTSIQF